MVGGRGRGPRSPASGGCACRRTSRGPTWSALDGDWSFAMRDRPDAVTRRRPRGPDRRLGDGGGAGLLDDAGLRPPAVHERADAVPGSAAARARRQPHRRVPPRGRRCPRRGAGSGSCCTSAAPESVLYVHVDGAPVGMGKDSRLPHEFDLTDIVEPGRALRARAHGREVVGRHLPRGPGSLVPRRSAPLACSSTRRRRCTSPTCTRSPTTTRTPATGTLRAARCRRRAGSAERPAGATSPSPARAADVHVRFEHPTNWVVNFLRFEVAARTSRSCSPASSRGPPRRRLSTTSPSRSSTASPSSSPSAAIVIIDPRAAASSSMPMMLLPSISRPWRVTRTRDWKRVARWTNFAAARACMPSWFTTVDRSATSRAGLLSAQQVRRDPDRAAAVVAHLLGDGEQIGRAPQASPA